MAFNALTFTVGEVLTAAKMNNLQGNFTGLANGDTTPDSAPKVQTAALEQTNLSEAVTRATIRAQAVGQTELDNDAVDSQHIVADAVQKAEIDNAAVGTGELNTTNTTQSTALASLDFLLSPIYGFYPFIKATTGINTARQLANVAALTDAMMTNGNSVGTYVRYLRIGEFSSGTATIQMYYVAASPPYDLGDGEIPEFIYALVDKTTAEIKGVGYGQDPPWALINPGAHADTYDKDGIGYKIVKDLPADALDLKAQIEATRASGLPATADDIAKVKAYSAMHKAAGTKRVVVTQNMKNEWMDRFPHHYIDDNLAGNNVECVLLDPVADLTWELHEMHKAGENIEDLFYEGYIDVTNTELPRAKPGQLKCVDYRFKP